MNYANQLGYSDVSPFEVVRHVSDKTVEIRAMNAVRSNPTESMGFQAGGFVGHFADQERQRWEITSNPEARVFRIRLQKDGKWRCKHGNRYALSERPVKFYDYNF